MKTSKKKTIFLLLFALVLIFSFFYQGENKNTAQDEKTIVKIQDEEKHEVKNSEKEKIKDNKEKIKDDVEKTPKSQKKSDENKTDSLKKEEKKSDSKKIEKENKDGENLKKEKQDAVKNTQKSENSQICEKNENTCYLTVDCSTILKNMDRLDKSKADIIPKDGIIFKRQKVEFKNGDSAFDVLKDQMVKNKIHMEFSKTPVYDSNYIEGISNIYEFDCGELSGWMYSVNGRFPNYGSSRYILKNGDEIKFIYTCDLGEDIGNKYKEDGEKDEKK